MAWWDEEEESFGELPNPTLGEDLPAPWSEPTDSVDQEALGRQIVEGTQQEVLGRQIVEDTQAEQGWSLGGLFDTVGDFGSGLATRVDSAEPWFKSMEATLGGLSRVLPHVKGNPPIQRDSAPGGIPSSRNNQTAVGPITQVRRMLSVWPQTVNGGGQPGVLLAPPQARRAATITTEVGGMDFLTIGLVAVGGFVVYRWLT